MNTEEKVKRNIEIPCEIGDTVYAIRNYKGQRTIRSGIVSEIIVLPNMKLQIVVRGVARGQWGEKIFPTFRAAKEALKRIPEKQKDICGGGVNGV